MFDVAKIQKKERMNALFYKKISLSCLMSLSSNTDTGCAITWGCRTTTAL